MTIDPRIGHHGESGKLATRAVVLGPIDPMVRWGKTGGVGTTVELIAAILLPTAVGYAAVFALRFHARHVLRRHGPVDRSIESLEGDLRRLHADLDRTELEVGTPGKNLRRVAVRSAYVDTLTVACVRLGIAPPSPAGGSRTQLAEIYRAEAALRWHGVDVRSPVGP
jgi:hypothetical protein